VSKDVHNARPFAAWPDVNGWSPGAVHPLAADGASSDTRLRLEAARDLPPQLRDVFERHSAFVFRSLRYLGFRDPAIDEAFERVFVLAHRHIQATGELPGRDWLFAASKRIAREQSTGLAAPAFEPAPGVDRGALAFGHALLGVLSEEQREVFWLYEVEDLPVREIARALRRPERSIRSSLLGARQRVVAEVERIAAGTHDE